MMWLPEGRKSFKIDLAVLIQYRRVTSIQPASHVSIASRPTRYTYLRRAVKAVTKKSIMTKIFLIGGGIGHIPMNNRNRKYSESRAVLLKEFQCVNTKLAS